MEAAVTGVGDAGERAGAGAPRRSPRRFASPPPSAPDEVAIRTKGDAFTITWGELRERVDALAGGLAELGLQRGDSARADARATVPSSTSATSPR